MAERKEEREREDGNRSNKEARQAALLESRISRPGVELALLFPPVFHPKIWVNTLHLLNYQIARDRCTRVGNSSPVNQ